MGTDIDDLENEPKIKVGLFLPTSQMDQSRGYPEGTLYIRRTTNEIFISRDDTTDAAVWEPLTTKKYEVGDVGPAGGWVFFVTDDGLHGLEAAPEDTQFGLRTWGCSGTAIPGTDFYLGSGLRNTNFILQACSERVNAASLAESYYHNGYTDWFLPCSDETGYMVLRIGPNSPLGNVGGFTDGLYWSSTQAIGSAEDPDLRALSWAFGASYTGAPEKTLKDTMAAVRAIRKF